MPHVFIGSSAEGKRYADAVFSELESISEPTVWDQDLFHPSKATIESLETFARAFDFAIFVLTPDDMRASRGISAAVPRDNLIFELGLFIGTLGRDRVWFVTPKQEQITLPSDLLGVAQLGYRAREDQNYRAAVRTACSTIRDLIGSTGVRSGSRNKLVSYWHTIPERQRNSLDIRNLISHCVQRVFVSGITLSYVAHYCRQELKAALSRGVNIELVIARDHEESVVAYGRYSPLLKDNLPLSHKRYRVLWEELRSAGLPTFALFGATVPLTHSIGLYDETVYVSEFCIDTESARVPSFCVPLETPSYEVFLSEIRILLEESVPLLGPTASRIRETL